MIKTFIEKLKARGLTQNEIAEKTGLKQSFISQLYNGKKPSLDTVLKFAEAFNVTTDEVLGRKDPQNLEQTSKPTKPGKPKPNSYLG